MSSQNVINSQSIVEQGGWNLNNTLAAPTCVKVTIVVNKFIFFPEQLISYLYLHYQQIRMRVTQWYISLNNNTDVPFFDSICVLKKSKTFKVLYEWIKWKVITENLFRYCKRKSLQPVMDLELEPEQLTVKSWALLLMLTTGFFNL